MAALHHQDDAQVCFEEEGMLWLPTSVVYHLPCDSKVYTRYPHLNLHHQQRLRRREPLPHQLSKCSSRWYQRPKHGNGGPGMQAIFLESGQRSCGTGVFLPQRAGTNFQSTKKPACSPVLLPARVVQALNLNVHALGLQVSPCPDHPKRSPRKREGVYNSSSKKKNEPKDAFKQCGVVSEDQSSPELFLPKEWTY